VSDNSEQAKMFRSGIYTNWTRVNGPAQCGTIPS